MLLEKMYNGLLSVDVGLEHSWGTFERADHHFYQTLPPEITEFSQAFVVRSSFPEELSYITLSPSFQKGLFLVKELIFCLVFGEYFINDVSFCATFV
jgi:hypothetical protein